MWDVFKFHPIFDSYKYDDAELNNVSVKYRIELFHKRGNYIEKGPDRDYEWIDSQYVNPALIGQSGIRSGAGTLYVQMERGEDGWIAKGHFVKDLNFRENGR